MQFPLQLELVDAVAYKAVLSARVVPVAHISTPFHAHPPLQSPTLV